MENESPLNYISNLTVGGQPIIERHHTNGKHYPLFKKSKSDAKSYPVQPFVEPILTSGLNKSKLPEILFITSYPPRECGIATYSKDLIEALNNKFDKSFKLSICPLESENEKHSYYEKIKYSLNTSDPNSFNKMAFLINKNEDIQMVIMQHEFGFFQKNEADFNAFVKALTKPLIIAFHTVLPYPNEALKIRVKEIANYAKSIIVMTNSSAEVLKKYYDIDENKISVISHGTHLVPHADKNELKLKYNLKGKFVLATFGLLSSGKGVEMTLNALPEIVSKHSNVHFLIIGKTHPTIKKEQGEHYREMLEQKVIKLNLQDHVQFINSFLPLPELLEYLQLTDIYLFTSRDPNQAVSGTFSYAISCGCPIISTPIPHAKEVLQNESGIIIDFDNPSQLCNAVNKLIDNETLRENISSNGLHQMASTAWENSAIAHAILFEKLGKEKIFLHYSIPEINLNHIKKMTTDFGMIQFSILNKPDLNSGYTLDDNSGALIAMCQHFKKTIDPEDIKYISNYFYFIKFCLQPEGYFLNYVNKEKAFTEQNNSTNLADSNGRAIWALGYMISISKLLPTEMKEEAIGVMDNALLNVTKIYSTRAIAFAIKGIYYRNSFSQSEKDKNLIIELTNRLVQMYRHEKNDEWHWFESYFT